VERDHVTAMQVREWELRLRYQDVIAHLQGRAHGGTWDPICPQESSPDRHDHEQDHKPHRHGQTDKEFRSEASLV
jgi:hypothetical protein